MEKITIFTTDTSVEKISEFLLLADEFPVFTQDRHYMFAKMPSPKELAEKVKVMGDQHLVYGEGKTVWVHKYPEILFRILVGNGIAFSIKEILILSAEKKSAKKESVVL